MSPQPRNTSVDDFLEDDAGVISTEYAVVIFIAVTLAGVLLLIVQGDAVRETLAALVDRALGSSP